MTKLSLPLATAVTLAVALVGLLILAGDGESVRAQEDGDLLLDWAIEDNTPTSVGVIDTDCRSFSAGLPVQIDVIAVNAVDWAGMVFLIEFPPQAVVSSPGPASGQEGEAFDFVPFDDATAATFGSQNFLFPDSSDNNADYSTSEVVPDGSSPHGVSMFDNSLTGNSGSGGMARVSLDTTALTPGVYTLSLTTGFNEAMRLYEGGVHSDARGSTPDIFGSVFLAVEADCPTGTPIPTQPPASPSPEGTPGPPSPNGGDNDGDSIWLTVGFVVGGVIAALAVVAAVSRRRRRSADK